jgi:hypothetical protein
MEAILVSNAWLFHSRKNIVDAQQAIRAGVPSFFTSHFMLRSHMCYISSAATYM